MAYDNTNKGTLSPNKYKQEGDKKPDFIGKFNYKGEEFKLAGWNRAGQNGPFISIAVDTYVPKPKPEAAASNKPDEDIPW